MLFYSVNLIVTNCTNAQNVHQKNKLLKKKELMRYQLVFVFLMTCFLSQAQEIELQKLKGTIDSLDLLISKNEQKIKLLNDENNKMLVKKSLIISRRNEMLTRNEIGEIYVCIVGTVIYERPSGTYDLVRLESGDKVKVIGTNDKLYQVLFKGTKGYVWKNALLSELDWNLDIQKKEEEARLEKIKEEKAEQDRIANNLIIEKEQKLVLEKRKKDQQNATAKRIQAEKDEKIEIEKRKTRLVEKYGSEIGLKIFEKEIWIGMTKEMLLESWGNPSDINRSIGSWGVHEQCVYYNRYVYVQNGVVTSYQD